MEGGGTERSAVSLGARFALELEGLGLDLGFTWKQGPHEAQPGRKVDSVPKVLGSGLHPPLRPQGSGSHPGGGGLG